jgi:hypothetical protein
MGCECKLDSAGSEQRLESFCREHGNEPSGSV